MLRTAGSDVSGLLVPGVVMLRTKSNGADLFKSGKTPVHAPDAPARPARSTAGLGARLNWIVVFRVARRRVLPQRTRDRPVQDSSSSKLGPRSAISRESGSPAGGLAAADGEGMDHRSRSWNDPRNAMVGAPRDSTDRLPAPKRPNCGDEVPSRFVEGPEN